MKRSLRIDLRLILIVSVLTVSFLLSCSRQNKSTEYSAEKMLFKARKMKEELTSTRFRQEFFDKTIAAYREIIEKFKGRMHDSSEVENIVVSAQLELAELYYRAGFVDSATANFKRAIALAKNVPKARAGAVYSVAAIAEELGNLSQAIDYYKRFHDEFLSPFDIKKVSSVDRGYLVAPIKLAQLNRVIGKEGESNAWLARAERLYRAIESSTKDTTLLKTARFNLLTTYLEGKRWKDALNLAKSLRQTYSSEKEAPSIEFIIAQIYRDGLGKTDEAYKAFLKIKEVYPKSQEAPLALIAAAAIAKGKKQNEDAERLYTEVIKNYPDNSAIIEAEWQLAQLEESLGKWVDASLRYKNLYSKYPASIQGLEAPIRIIKYYLSKGEKDAAKAAYEQAIEHYDNLVKKEIPVESRLMAEEYAVRAMAEYGDWRKAVERLIELPVKYPFYGQFKGNYLYAASICEKELKDREKAKEILKKCIENYPGTNLAREAEKQLNRLGG